VGPSSHLNVDVRRVLDGLDLDPTLIGREYVMKCPFHQERGSPNLEVNSETGLWHCWVCGAKGNITQLIGDLRSVSYREAIHLLEEYSDVPTVAEIRARNLRELDAILRPPSSRDFPELDIRRFMPGRSWWRSVRGYDITTISTFSLGYDSRHHWAVVPVQFLGKWVGIIRRATSEKQMPRYRYDRDFPKGQLLYAWDYIPDEATSCCIVEGSTDVHRWYSFGYTNTVAILGTGITAQQQRLLTERFDELVLIMDNDPAGHIATLRNAEQLAGYVPRVMIAPYDEILKKDPGEMSQTEAMQIMGNLQHWSALLA
jgi:DNA primase